MLCSNQQRLDRQEQRSKAGSPFLLACQFEIVPQPGMENDNPIAGGGMFLVLLIVAPFIIAAIPVLLGATLGIVGFWVVILLISAFVRAIFK